MSRALETAGAALARASRLLCVPVRDHAGPGADEIVAERRRHPWGGYVFFGGDAGAVGELIGRLRDASPEPLLFASDLERGVGQQLRGGTTFPPPMTLGAAGDPALCREIGRATAAEARAVGLNAVFAPVLDLASEPENPIVCTRAFGDDPEAVAELGAATIAGLQEGGVLATAKHFPGHGRTRRDSHAELPLVEAPLAELLSRDLVPFRRAVEGGVALVMSAHVAFPALEPPGAPPRPATLSRAALHGLLRGELGFRGAVVSDALMMGAVAAADPVDLAARALEAGVDCLLYPPDPALVACALARRLEDGALDAGRVDEALARLDAALARASAAAVPPIDGRFGELALRAARAGVAALDGPALPAAAGRSLVLLVLDGGIARDDVVLHRVAEAPGREFRWVMPEEGAEIPGDLSDFEAVALAWFSPIRAWKGRAGMSAEARAVAAALFTARPDASLISFSSPFILRGLPRPRAALFAFGEAAACQVAIGEVLAGRASPAGRLPVRVQTL